MSGWLNNQAQLTAAAAALGAVVAIAWLAAQLAARAARAGLMRVAGDDAASRFSAPIVRKPIRIIWSVVFLLVGAMLMMPALDLAGLRVRGGLDFETLAAWLLGPGLRIVLITLLAYSVARVVGAVVGRFEHEVSRANGSGSSERAKRATTLGRLVRNVLNILLYGVAGLMVLQQLQINVLPVLTGAGIAGLAVGFGAQTLVRDVISGFFLILEDQVRVGDVASVNGTAGQVESINLRTITLRDLSGTVHIFPNGSVQQMSNLTKDFAYYVVDMGVAYKEDTDQVVRVMRQVAEDLAADEAYGRHMLAPLEVLGVDAFDESQVTIKVRLKTQPLRQWEVGREYRRRVKKAFDARGIEIPFPHLSVYFGEASKPWRIDQQGPADLSR